MSQLKVHWPCDCREWIEEQSQQYYDVHSKKLSRERKYDLLITHSEVHSFNDIMFQGRKKKLFINKRS